MLRADSAGVFCLRVVRHWKAFCMAMSFGACFGARSRGTEMVNINLRNYLFFIRRLFHNLISSEELLVTR